MNFISKGWIALLLAQPAFLCGAKANLIVNGDFSGGVTGWTTAGVAAISSGIVTYGGGSANNGTVYQAITTEPDKWYAVTYDHRSHNTVYSPWTLIMATAYNGAGVAAANAYWGASSQRAGTTFTTYTHYFQARSDTTTLQFSDYNYSGSSQDVYIDNVNVELVPDFTQIEVNIASRATLGQSSFYNAGSFPATMATDGQITSTATGSNFMHSLDTEGDADPNTKTMDLVFDQDYEITRIALSPRWGFLQRAGDSLQLFNAADAVIGTVTLGDTTSYYANNNAGAGWFGVRKIRITENGTGNALNFSEIEVYTLQAVVPEPASLGLMAAGLALLGVWKRRTR